jgi:hypothetical protein
LKNNFTFLYYFSILKKRQQQQQLTSRGKKMRTFTIIDEKSGTVIAGGLTTCPNNDGFFVKIVNEGLIDSETRESVEWFIPEVDEDEVEEFLDTDDYELIAIEENV